MGGAIVNSHVDMRPIILDCDPGQDDAVAILLALASAEELQVLGITTVAGNVPLEKTQRNARLTCDPAGRKDVPVFAGCPPPILRPLYAGEYVHGREGVGGPDIRQPEPPLANVHA